MYQAKSGVKNFSLYSGGGVPPGKVAQNELKQILVLEFLRSDDFWGEVGGGPSVRYKCTTQGSHISRLTKFHDISMIFPGFSKKFQVYFLNILMWPPITFGSMFT